MNINFIHLNKTKTPVLLKVLTHKEVPLNKNEVKELSNLSFDCFNFKQHKEGHFEADDFTLSDGRVLSDILATQEKDLITATSFANT